jgi:CRISP-associated protein Cas1
MVNEYDIPLTILNWNVILLGLTLPRGPKAGKLRIKQYQKYLDNKMRLKITEEIVNCKINTLFNLLKELAKYYSEINIELIAKLLDQEKADFNSVKIKSKIISFENNNENNNQTKKLILNTLMNYEGGIAMIYWQYLAKIFTKLHPEFHFQNMKNKSHSWNNMHSMKLMLS